MSVQHLSSWYLVRTEAGTGSPRNGLIEGCEIPCVCKELNPGTVEKQPPLSHLTRHNPLDFFVCIFCFDRVSQWNPSLTDLAE